MIEWVLLDVVPGTGFCEKLFQLVFPYQTNHSLVGEFVCVSEQAREEKRREEGERGREISCMCVFSFHNYYILILLLVYILILLFKYVIILFIPVCVLQTVRPCLLVSAACVSVSISHLCLRKFCVMIVVCPCACISSSKETDDTHLVFFSCSQILIAVSPFSATILTSKPCAGNGRERNRCLSTVLSSTHASKGNSKR